MINSTSSVAGTPPSHTAAFFSRPSAAIGNGFFFNVGEEYSGEPAVLSSQNMASGVPNILITFASAVYGFSLNYGTFDAE